MFLNLLSFLRMFVYWIFIWITFENNIINDRGICEGVLGKYHGTDSEGINS